MPLGDLMDLVVLIKSAVNFILYCALGQKFRRTFMRTFCEQCASPDAKGHQNNSHSCTYQMDKVASRKANAANGANYVKMLCSSKRRPHVPRNALPDLASGVTFRGWEAWGVCGRVRPARHDEN